MITKTSFEKWFLHSSSESEDSFNHIIDRTVKIIADESRKTSKPFAGTTRDDIESMVKEISELPVNGQELDVVMLELQEVIVRNSLWISHPSAMAHLHCPPLIPSIAAEIVISSLNQSMDSWDQSPVATFVEDEVIKYFTKQIGYSAEADGVFTSGGTQSNYMGLLLARNKAIQTYFSVNVQEDGLPNEAKKLRILCSEHAHFSVQQAAAQLGLGINSIVKVQTDEKNQLCLEDARKKVDHLLQQGLLPFMVIATAGTTDFGSVDNLTEIAKLANEHQLWLHVDAAYGGALLFSHQYRHLLHDLSLADSITVDFHKLYYQSISCGAFFVKHKQSFQQIAYYADYLNPEEDHEDGIINLVEKSVQTTKRFDALKILMTFKLLGTNTFGEMIDYTIQLAKETAELINHHSQFEVLNAPVINAVLFRYLPENGRSDQRFVDEINLEIQRYFYQSGELIMAKTKQNGNVYLKLTMLNPLNTISKMKAHIESIQQIGEKIESEKGARSYEYTVHY
jgi:L-2,4-diaminobutyrate decarboxylase